MDIVPGPMSASSIAGLEAVSVANIDSPTELNAIPGATVGERRVCYQAIANDNVYTVYYYDSADGSGASSPYVLAALTTGFWIASGGKYTNSAVKLRSTLDVAGVLTSTVTTGTAPFTVASTTAVTNLNASLLLGGTWAIPGSIGATTRAAGAFTTLAANGATSLTNTLAVTGATTLSSTVSQSFTLTDVYSTGFSNTSIYRCTTSATNNANGIGMSMRLTVANGQTMSGTPYAYNLDIRRNTDGGAASDGGTAGSFGGMFLFVGHGSSLAASPVTTSAYGINLLPAISSGTIGTFYGLRLQAASGAGTITTNIAISQEDTVATNAFAGVTTFSNSTASSSTSTGALVVAGGVGIGGAANIGGVVTLTNTAAQSLIMSGGLALTRSATSDNSYVSKVSGDTFNRCIITADGTFNWGNGAGAADTFLGRSAVGTVGITASTVSTTTGTGALVVAGGVGIGGALNVSGLTTIAGTSGLTVNCGNAQSKILIGNVTGNTSVYSTVQFGAGSSKTAWQFGCQININNGFEITPSTAAGGTTFSTPALGLTSTSLNIPSGSAYQINGTQVVAARDTGWTAMTGSPDKATAYATSTVTLAQLAGRVAQLQATLTAHGLIGA